ncbi:MAG: RDD family protein [Pseudomonadota bacterium]
MSSGESTATQDLPAPGLLRRLAAMVYDTLLVVPLVMLTSMTLLIISSALGGNDDDLLPPAIVQSIAVLCCVGFFAVFWLKSGQTLGMQAWRIKLVPAPGNTLTFGRAVTRVGSALLSAACFGMGYLWCLIDRRGRTWHDLLSGTELKLLPKRPKNTGKSPSSA